MRTTPWKPLFAGSVLFTAAGCAMFAWSISWNVGWEGTMVAVFVIVIGALQARMNYRAYRYAVLPTSRTTLPIVGVCVCALLWIASLMGLL